MLAVNQQLFNSLKNIRNDISEIKPGAADKIAVVGAAIEQLLTEYEESREIISLGDFPILCLTALQKIYEDENADFAGIMAAIGAGFIAAEQSVSLPDNEVCQSMVTQACELLRVRLEDSPEASENTDANVLENTETENAENAENYETISVVKQDDAPLETFVSTPLNTLDDVSSLLFQIGADNAPEVARICDALKEISAQTEDSAHRKQIVKAARDLTKIVKGKISSNEAEEVLMSVGEMIESINSENEKSENLPTIQNEKQTSVETDSIPETETVEADSFASVGKIPFEEDTSLLLEFLVESRELIEAAEASLLSLENDPEDIEAINTVFRAFHSVKGTSTFLGLNDLTAVGHLAESLLSRMRDREIRCTGGYADLALRSVDFIKAMLNFIEEALPGKPDSLPAGYKELIKILENPEANGVTADADGKPEVRQESDEHFAEIPEISEKRKTSSTDSSVRVRTDRLDSLIDMVGELVIAQSMLAQDSTVAQGLHHELSRKISHAGKIVRELQDLSMAMRMIPLKSTFQKMARIVRDVAQKCGKQIEFVTEGEDTEIDRNMVDIIADPLVHMVRNAADHGIETPDVRQKSGKSPVGKIKLSAYHAGGDVVVELTDDGAGLDRDKIVAKAIAIDLIESDKGLSENQIFNLIFAPGFSTADQITNVSGRGVGMDVVKRNIEGMRGRIEISSEKSKGSLFTIRLPLTLAITDGMLVRVGAERFIVPTINIQLSFRPNDKMLSTVSGRGELVSLRGELMPIFRLHKLFEVENAIENPTEALLMIVADGRRRCALMVDELLGQYQVVAKTLGEGIGKVPGVSGGAILGDGCVGLILDLAELVALARRNRNAADRVEETYQLAA